MSRISFSNKPPVTQPAAQEPVIEVTPEVIHPETTTNEEPAASPADDTTTTIVLTDRKEVSLAVGNPTVVPVAAGVEGEITTDNIKLPRINLVQKVGNLADSFHPGSIVFEKQVVLTEGKTPIDLTPLRIRKQYQQKLEWGESDNEQPQVYDTAAEVRANGGSLIWGDARYFGEIAHIQFAIKLPGDADVETADEEGMTVSDLFPYEVGGDRYALAMWTVGSSAFTALAKPILTAATNLLRNGLYHGHYLVTTEIRKNARNSWYAPVPKFAGKHDAETAEFFRQIAGL